MKPNATGIRLTPAERKELERTGLGASAAIRRLIELWRHLRIMAKTDKHLGEKLKQAEEMVDKNAE